MTVVHPCVCTLFVPSSAELEASQRTTEVLKEDLYAAEQELMKEKALNRNAEARITSVRFHSKQCHWLLPTPPPHTHTHTHAQRACSRHWSLSYDDALPLL